MKKEMEDLLDKSQTDLLAKIAVMLLGRDPERGKGVVINSDAMINESGNAQDGIPCSNEPAYQASPSRKLVVHEGLNECTVPDLNEIEKLKDEIPKQFEDLYKQLEDKVKNVDPSPNISKLSTDETDLEPAFEQEECLDESQDFEEDLNCDLSPELLRMMEHEEKQILPHKEFVEVVSIGEENEQKEVKIGTCITAETRKTLIALLQEFKDVFAWSYQDMPGLDTDIVVHKLPIKENGKPVQQKLRRMRPDVLLKIKEEKDGKVRMCVDYRDLNKASPKDNFPLPHIDTLVDNTSKQSFFSFMDGFSGYNQIRMHPDDMDKTTFVTPWGTSVTR
ncbi:hypothetical protein GQ457_10G006280 [Hibiscus cannabinus]